MWKKAQYHKIAEGNPRKTNRPSSWHLILKGESYDFMGPNKTTQLQQHGPPGENQNMAPRKQKTKTWKESPPQKKTRRCGSCFLSINSRGVRSQPKIIMILGVWYLEDDYPWLVVWNIFYFCPDPWGKDPIWLAYFSDGLKPSTRIPLVASHCTRKNGLETQPGSPSRTGTLLGIKTQGLKVEMKANVSVDLVYEDVLNILGRSNYNLKT